VENTIAFELSARVRLDLDLSSIELKYFVLSIIVVYIPFHLFEEAIGNFPETMYRHKWIPERITHGHWMANNIFFYFPILVIGYSLFLINDAFVSFGVGILFWGVINFIDHVVYTIVDRRISPGIVTGILFGVVPLLAFAGHGEKLNLLIVSASAILGVGYASLPIIFSMLAHKLFKKIFL